MHWIGGHLPAGNLSGGFHDIIFKMIEKYHSGNSVLMVGERKEIEIDIKNRISFADLHFLEYDGGIGEKFDIDLNIIQEFNTKYDAVICQALLEHVCRPSVVIENISNLLKKDGVAIFHTHNVLMGYHAYPIDCVRFYKDFFVDLCKYIDVDLIDYHEEDIHIFAVYKKRNIES